MGYAMIWLAGLATALLAVAVVSSLSARLKLRWLQIGLPAVMAFVFTFLGITATATAGEMRFYSALIAGELPALGSPWLAYCLWWTIIFSVLSGLGLFVFSIRRSDGPAPRAGQWNPKKLSIALGLVLSVLLMTIWNMDLAMRTKLASLKIEANAIAISLTPPRIPDSRNAALYYEKALETMPGLKDNRSRMELINNFMTADLNSSEVKNLLNDAQGRIRLLKEAADMEECNFEHDYSLFHMANINPTLFGLLDSSRLLALAARSKAAQGESRSASEYIAAIYRMADHASSEPMLVPVLIGIGIDAIGFSALGSVLHSADGNSVDMGQVLDNIPSFRKRVFRALEFEHASILSVFCMFSEDNPMDLFTIIEGSDSMQLFFLFPEIVPNYIWRIFIIPDELKLYRRIKARFNEIEFTKFHLAREKRLLKEIQPAGPITSLIAVAPMQQIIHGVTTDMKNRLAVTALAVEKYRHKTGKYPSALEELTPEYLPAVPMDLFDGKKLKMISRQGGLVLYSVGPNKTDDKGIGPDISGSDSSKPDDIFFRLGGAYKTRCNE